MRLKFLLLLSLLIFAIGSALYAQDANTPADPNANDPNIAVPE